jgi:8-oxo-dGTP diphosphatase
MYENPLIVDYVLGFMFDSTAEGLILIQKNKPANQKGFLNGVGGKVEENELAIEAMIREFREETGVQTNPEDWKEFATLQSSVFDVTCFAGRSEKYWLDAKTVESEPIFKVWVDELFYDRSSHIKCMPNLKYLIPLACHFITQSDIVEPVIFNYQ